MLLFCSIGCWFPVLREHLRFFQVSHLTVSAKIKIAQVLS